jgi:hypothetical protein
MKHWQARAGVPADARIVDFARQTIFEPARQGGAVCLLKLATTPLTVVGNDADLT